MNKPEALSFEEILQVHGGSVYRICKAYVGLTVELDDLYQEAIINVWKSLKSFRNESKLSTWIYRVAVNTAITHRHKINKQSMRESYPETMDFIQDDLSDRQAKQEREAQYGQLLLAIEQLKPDQRIIIGLFLEDLSYKEIADVIGKDTNYVGVKLSRIKDQLAKLMNQ